MCTFLEATRLHAGMEGSVSFFKMVIFIFWGYVYALEATSFVVRKPRFGVICNEIEERK